MRLKSDSIENGKPIPATYAFMEIGEPIKPAGNVTPHLAWTEVPASAKSFAIAVIDTDVPSKPDDVNVEGRDVPRHLPRVEFVHWLMANIPLECRELGEGACGEGVVARGKKDPIGPPGSVQGLNDYTSWFKGDRDMEGHYHGYDGPCPPWNDSIAHRYHFHVYALDVDTVSLENGFSLADLRDVIKGHVVGEAVITGTYSLNPKVKP
jgi:Raf kinase inhibitor-like YbhB/YbcL family protein